VIGEDWKVQGGTSGSEFRIPDSELSGSVELRIPSPQPSHLAPVPSDKILFPRRMLYVDAVLYLVLAAIAFGMGYLFGRGGRPALTSDDAAVQRRVPVEGKVLANNHGDAGAVVLIFPEKAPGKKLPLHSLGPGASWKTDDPLVLALSEIGGAATGVDANGNFASPLFVPEAGNYRILVVSGQVTGESGLKENDRAEISMYLDNAEGLLRGRRYQWLTRELSLRSRPLDVAFSE
jgi:hypothetical protein